MAHAGRLRTDVQSVQSKGYYANYAVSAACRGVLRAQFRALLHLVVDEPAIWPIHPGLAG